MRRVYRFIIIILAAGWSAAVFPFSTIAGEQAGFTRKHVEYTPEWGSQTIITKTKPELHEYFRTYTPHRLDFQCIWMVANVMDDDGNKYNLLRMYSRESSSMVLASREVPGLDSSAEQVLEHGSMYLGRIYHEMDEENGLILVKPLIPRGPAFRIEIRPQHHVWKDADGKIDLEFEALAPAVAFYTPGEWEDAMYRSEQCFVKGTLNGKPVSGWGNLDMSWGPSGVGFTQSKIYKLMEQHWMVFLNIYEDGTREGGVFVNGLDQMKVGYYYKNGEGRIGEKTTFDVIFTDDGFPKEATVQMDDMTFQFTTESRIAKAEAYVSWASGRVVNKAEKRKPVKTFSWFEFFPK